MFFYKKIFKQNPKTFIEINIKENDTDISLYEKYGSFKSDSISIKQGFKDILEESYNNAKYFHKLGDISMDCFLEKHSNIVRQDVSKFMQHIEFRILCGLELPSKIQKICFKCEGPELFKKEFESKFNFYNKEKTAI